MKTLIAAALMAAISSPAMAGGYYGWYHPSNTANANGSANADSSSSTSGQVVNYGSEGFQSATSGAFNNSAASTGINYSETTGTAATQSASQTDYINDSLTVGINTVDNEANQFGSGPDASYDNSTTNDSVEVFANSSWTHGYNDAQQQTQTNFGSANFGTTSSTSTNGGAFGNTVGWGASTDSSYGGKADAWSGSDFNFHEHF